MTASIVRITRSDLGQAIEEQLARGRCFAAFDEAKQALEHHPNDPALTHLAALALVRCGAVENGRALLETVEPAGLSYDAARRQARAALEAGLDEIAEERAATREATWVDDLAQAVTVLGGGRERQIDRDVGTVRVLAEIFQESWRHLGRRDDLERARDLWLEASAASMAPDAAIAAASLSLRTGDASSARQLAERALRQTPVSLERMSARTAGAIATAALLTGDHPRALEALAAAREKAAAQPGLIAELRSELQGLAASGLEVSADALALLAPPVIVLFAGQEAGADPANSFTDTATSVRLSELIRTELDELDARIGYASAAAGPEILFLEAMLDRGGEVNVVLPYEEKDFVSRCVRPAGDVWLRRYRHVRRLADDTIRVSEDPALDHALVRRHANRVLDGTARLRARALDTEPWLIAACDFLATAEPGGPADFMDHWGDPSRLRVLDLGSLLPDQAAARGDAAPSEPMPVQQDSDADPVAVVSMLFADIVGFSRIADNDVARLWRFLAAVHEDLRDLHPSVRLIDSWGDALHVVMDQALTLTDYATALLAALEAHDPVRYGLDGRPQLRIGLHAGPVQETLHPLSQRRMVYGGNVNRAARIEPITVPGHIYASQQFVALLTAEESMLRHEAILSGQRYDDRYRVRYLGITSLAKGFGDQAIYMVERADRPGASM